MLFRCLLDDGCQFALMLSATWHTIDKRLLNVGVHVLMCKNEEKPSVLENGCEELSNTGGQGDRPKIGRITVTGRCRALRNQPSHCLLPCNRDGGRFPTCVEETRKGWKERWENFEDLVVNTI